MAGKTKLNPSGAQTGRRKFIASTAVLAGAAFGGVAMTATAQKGAQKGVLLIASERENICATCQFWGAKRRISRDGKHVAVKSLGWCNNRKSPNFGNTTGPQTGPMKVWEKWEAIGS